MTSSIQYVDETVMAHQFNVELYALCLLVILDSPRLKEVSERI